MKKSRFSDAQILAILKQGGSGKGIRFSDESKQDAVAQVVERGYSVSEVAELEFIDCRTFIYRL